MSSLIQNLKYDIKSLPQAVWILIIGQFINRFGAFVFPFLTLILSERNLTPGQIAAVMACMSLGHFAGPIASGYLADAIGRRNTILVSLFGSSSTVIILYYCHNPVIIAFVAMLNGFLTMLFGPASTALMTDLVPADKRVTAFALWRLAVNGGFAAGPAVAGLLFTRAPALIFYGDALTTMVFAVISWIWLPHGLRTIRGRAMSPKVALQSWISALSDMRGNKPYLQFIVVVLFIGLAFNQVFNVLVLTATDRGLSPYAYGLLMALNGLLIVMFELPLTVWAQRFPVRIVLAFGYMFIGIGCGLFGVADSIGEFVVGMVVFTFGEMLALPLGLAYSSNLAPETYRGRYFGIRGMAWAFAGLIGSLGLWGYGHIGNWIWLAVAASAFMGTVTILPNLSDRRTINTTESVKQAGV